jgi:diacylglycerol kinase (ATP)
MVAFLFNPSSGRGKSLKKRPKIEAHLKKYGIEYEWFVSKSEAHLKQLAREVASSFPMIVTVGGDTTFTLVAAEILKMSSGVILGMVGTGSANDIARGLGYYHLDAFCQALKTGNRRPMDIVQLEINGIPDEIHFGGALSLGLGVEVSRYIEDFRDRYPLLYPGGRVSQTLMGIRAIRSAFAKKSVPKRARLKVDNIQQEVEYSLLAIANIPYYANGIRLFPDMTPFSGRLECCVVNSTSFLHTIVVGDQAIRGKHLQRNEVRMFSGTSFEISSYDDLDVQYDGEIIPSVREFRVTVLPGAVNVLA